MCTPNFSHYETQVHEIGWVLLCSDWVGLVGLSDSRGELWRVEIYQIPGIGCGGGQGDC